MSKMHGRENDSVEVEKKVEKSDVALREEGILSFWEEHDIFNKSMATPAGATPLGDFVFYDGPPFATGLPHYGHILAGTIKDAIPRFWTMNGYRVRRKWGWDCHGLPLENLIEKKLGLATKRDIEEYGVKNFNEAARAAVMEYADDWKQIIPRMGRFADMENDYKTMDSTYTESVWWVFKQLHEKGMVFEGFKTMHLCPRCGTTLSNFEVNQGYKDIKDIAVTVKLPLLDDAGVVTDTSLLVWTTTPWTMPGNLAAAVNAEFEYVKVKITTDEGTENVILAKGRLAQLDGMETEVQETMKGSELVGRSYQPPFPWLAEQEMEGRENAWKIWHADYVEVGEDGTGAVHIAPAFGDDDMKLAQEHGVPIVHHVNNSGHFEDWVTDFAGQLVKPKDDDESGVTHLDADIEIVKALKVNGRLLKKENITHSYPHCWRCDTPLLNYATTSWFVDVPSIKDKLVAENDKVNWVPEHVGTNRFGKWLEGARDWAVSRQRYWGAPLPIWRNPETKDYKVFGSLQELQEHTPKSGNTYFVARHAEAESNITGAINALPGTENGLTEKGVSQCQSMADALKDKGVTKIVHSGLQRTRETAEYVAKALGLPPEAVVEDSRIVEYQVGAEYEGKTWEEFNTNFSSESEKFEKHLPGVETRRELIQRAGDFLYEFETSHNNETTLLVGHGSSTFALRCVAEGANMERTLELKTAGYLGNAVVVPLEFTPLPHNDHFELDFHRPYIDDVVLEEDGVRLERVPDVFDCWFESGSMPYGQRHFMGEAQSDFDPDNNIGLPAQFIAEGLDQTRGWFYSLIVLGTALFGKSPYENVIVNGLIMAEDGKKLSKKLQNYSAPTDLVNNVGADSVRMYLLSSPVIRGEDINFSDKEVLELQRKNIGRLHNVLALYEMFADDSVEADSTSTNVLDRWVLARLHQLIAESTEGYKKYELDRATRPLTDFIDDLSVWYVRRSRERMKGEDVTDKTLALSTLKHVLIELAKVMAPAMPFYAEYLYKALHTDEVASVHLSAWPKVGPVDTELMEEMVAVREVVTGALEARTKAGIKVRQPIAGVTGPALQDELASVVLDELNAKAYMVGEQIMIDTTLTSELINEGAARELMRAVQGGRKAEGLAPSDRITLTVGTSDAGKDALAPYVEMITKTVGADTITFSAVTEGTTCTVGDHSFMFTIVTV